jgi:predicted outer membrane repeat protein
MAKRSDGAPKHSGVRGAIVLAAIAVTAAAAADVIYVDDSATGANTGENWDDAFTDLQAALAVAQTGDEIRIGQGTYKPAPPGGQREATFSLVDGVMLRGGYAGTGATDPGANDPEVFITTFSGDLNGDDLKPPNYTNHVDNTFHVASAHSVVAHVAGVTVESGYASDSRGPHDRGAGIVTTSSTLHLTQVTISGNSTRHYGAGVFAAEPFESSSVHLTDCHVRNNSMPLLSSYGGGGGVYAGPGSTLTRCVFEFNGAGGGKDGGALIAGGETVVDQCVFRSNSAEDGGAISGSAVILNSLFIDNTAGYWGGAIVTSGDTTIINCRFLENRAGIEGGAITNRGFLVALNCLFGGNIASDHAGAILNMQMGSALLESCTVVGNHVTGVFTDAALHQRGSETMYISNSIVWGNTSGNSEGEAAQIRLQDGAIVIHHSSIEGWTGVFGGVGNNGEDPLFIDADGPDDLYGTTDDNPRLSAASPARDSGDNAILPADEFDLDDDGDITELLPIDLDGRRRIVNRVVDRGCYEFQMCIADLMPAATQGDGEVDVLDLQAVIDAWGPCGPVCAADLNHDGAVGIDDLLLTISAWGACP